MEKVKPPKQKLGPGSGFFDAPDDPTLVTVASGCYAEALPLAGKTIEEVRQDFSERFDIDPKSTAVINGKDADESMMLVAGVTLMFLNRAGEKGITNIQLHPIRCKIVDVDGKEIAPGIYAATPEASKPHIGKLGVAVAEGDTVKITLDDGSIIYGDECWWNAI